MNLDRTKTPTIQALSKVNWLEVQKHTLANGVIFETLKAPSNEMVKLEWLFTAGGKYAEHPLLAQYAATLMKEGTKKHSAKEWNEMVDSFGAFVQSTSDRDTASIQLFVLKKHLASVLPLVAEMIFEPRFAQDDLEIHARNSQQNFIQDQEKVAVKSRKALWKNLFGAQHKYGLQVKEGDYLTLSSNDLQNYHKHTFLALPPKIMLVGELDEQLLNLIEQYFGTYNYTGKLPYKNTASINPATEKFEQVPMDKGLQSAIRIAKHSIAMTSPDYHALKVASTILGGYFGSRLMQNIREDKGYTYGVGCALVHHQEANLFILNTDVGNEFVTDTLVQIRKEISFLQENLVSEEELHLVKQYKSGEFLKSVDGAFAQSDMLNTCFTINTPEGFYENYLEKLNEVSALQVQAAAINHLNWEEMYCVVAGVVSPS